MQDAPISGTAAANEVEEERQQAWFDDQVEALMDAAEAQFGDANDEEGQGQRALLHLRQLIDTALDQLQTVALHNPCGDGEVVELADGEVACAGCFDETGAPRA